MTYKFLLSFLVLVSGAVAEESCSNDKVVFCYYSSWAVYRPMFGKFNISNIDPFLCTHYVFSFAGLDLEGKMMSMDPSNDLPENGGMQQYYYFRMMKEENPCIKVLLSIGGWDEGSEKYSVMAETQESRETFVEHALRFLIYYGFDGIDIDWEYPTQRGGISTDKQNLVLLLKLLRDRLGPRDKIITTAVGAGMTFIEEAYDVPEIVKYVDYILLMTYDYHRANLTTYMAPLKIPADDIHPGSIAESVEKWLELGCPPSKLVFGIQPSGRTYTLTSANTNNLGSPAKGPGQAGILTGIEGFLSYYEVCFLLSNDGDWRVSFNSTPYASIHATKGDQWITYEDPRTIKLKVEYAMEKKLAGTLVWTIDTDDFYPLCAEMNPIQNALREAMGLPVRKYPKINSQSRPENLKILQQ